MDPLSASFAFMAALAAAAVASEHLRRKQVSEFSRAWGEYLAAREQGVWRNKQMPPLTPEERVQFDVMQEAGEIPPGHVRLETGEIVPEEAYYPYVNELDSGTVDLGVVEEHSDVAGRVLSMFFAGQEGLPVWIHQISGHTHTGMYKTVVLDRPVKAMFVDVDLEHVWLDYPWSGAVDVRPELPVVLLEPPPSELISLMAPTGSVGTAEQRPLYYTGLAAVGRFARDPDADDDTDGDIEDEELVEVDLDDPYSIMRAAARRADDDGILQARDLIDLFPGRPTRTDGAATLRNVARWLEDDTGIDADDLIESTW